MAGSSKKKKGAKTGPKEERLAIPEKDAGKALDRLLGKARAPATAKKRGPKRRS